ncbi:MAG: 3'3'-cGAMP-specific phosphodiesterase 1 [Desulfovibrio sp.]
MQVTLNELLYSLSQALDFIEKELLGITTNHGKRAAYVSSRLCKATNMSDADIADMACCAILHDNALTSYMLEAGPQGVRQFERFESHCRRGEENIRDFPFAGDPKNTILHHHENWNGTGFHNLAGADIPQRAAFLRLADNMDLHLRMGDGRHGLIGEIREHAERHKGTLYSPQAVDTLCGLVDETFISDLSDANIDAALDRIVPEVPMRLTPKQVMPVCNIFAVIIDAKSPFTQNHSVGVAYRAGMLGTILGFDEERKDKLILAGYLHDVGKLSTPLEILEKPGKLSEEEFAVMQRHAAVTEEILSAVEGLEEISLWAASHHEKLNGSGYPHSSADSQIPLEARVLACCDIYQALTEERPYRTGMPGAKALDIMEEMAASGELDPGLVAVMRQNSAMFGA